MLLLVNSRKGLSLTDEQYCFSHLCYQIAETNAARTQCACTNVGRWVFVLQSLWTFGWKFVPSLSEIRKIVRNFVSCFYNTLHCVHVLDENLRQSSAKFANFGKVYKVCKVIGNFELWTKFVHHTKGIRMAQSESWKFRPMFGSELPKLWKTNFNTECFWM